MTIHMKIYKNIANVSARYGEYDENNIEADSNIVIITDRAPAICQCVERCYQICDFCRLIRCALYKTNVTIIPHQDYVDIQFEFVISMQYINFAGHFKEVHHRGMGCISNIPKNAYTKDINLHFRSLHCSVDKHCVLYLSFLACLYQNLDTAENT